MHMDITFADLPVCDRKIESTYAAQCAIGLYANVSVLPVAFISVDEDDFLSSLLRALELCHDDFRVGNPRSGDGCLLVASGIESAGR